MTTIDYDVIPRGLSPMRMLSPAEQRVVACATRGQSNRQIAAELWLTISTVEFHLTRVYRKLAISSRHELSAILDQDDQADAA